VEGPQDPSTAAKSKKDHRQSFRLTRNGFSVRPDGQLFVAKIGELRVRWSRTLPSEPSSVTVIREPDGHYFASFVVDVPRTPLRATDREAGGIARLATIADTDGNRIDVPNPRHLARKLQKLRQLEREKSRRQKGSTIDTRRGARSPSCTEQSHEPGATHITSRP
jgi:putative transposase